MSDEPLSSRSGKPTFIRKIAPWLLTIPSSLIGILLVEAFCRLLHPSIASNQNFIKALHRVMFFDGRDTIFRNEEDIFTFVRNDQIRNITGFFTDDDFNIEYDYQFKTNNFGLVEDADIVPRRQSLLLLGDSFTEGQGAEPWFRLVSPEIEQLGYQAINGGLLATGFGQWHKLERYLTAHGVQIRKLVVLFISDDYHRPLWNFGPATLQCLAALPLCRVDESYYYRLPPPEELASFIAKVRSARAPMMQNSWLGAHAAALLPASYQVYKYFSERVRRLTSRGGLDRAEQQSRAAIAELLRIYGPENVAFIHVPQKEEIDHGPDSLGLAVRRDIERAGGRLFDGFNLCRLTAADYYPNDDHPNRVGYGKIAVCVTKIIREMIPQVQ